MVNGATCAKARRSAHETISPSRHSSLVADETRDCKSLSEFLLLETWKLYAPDACEEKKRNVAQDERPAKRRPSVPSPEMVGPQSNLTHLYQRLRTVLGETKIIEPKNTVAAIPHACALGEVSQSVCGGMGKGAYLVPIVFESRVDPRVVNVHPPADMYTHEDEEEARDPAVEDVQGSEAQAGLFHPVATNVSVHASIRVNKNEGERGYRGR